MAIFTSYVSLPGRVDSNFPAINQSKPPYLRGNPLASRHRFGSKTSAIRLYLECGNGVVAGPDDRWMVIEHRKNRCQLEVPPWQNGNLHVWEMLQKTHLAIPDFPKSIVTAKLHMIIIYHDVISSYIMLSPLSMDRMSVFNLSYLFVPFQCHLKPSKSGKLGGWNSHKSAKAKRIWPGVTGVKLGPGVAGAWDSSVSSVSSVSSWPWPYE